MFPRVTPFVDFRPTASLIPLFLSYKFQVADASVIAPRSVSALSQTCIPSQGHTDTLTILKRIYGEGSALLIPIITCVPSSFLIWKVGRRFLEFCPNGDLGRHLLSRRSPGWPTSAAFRPYMRHWHVAVSTQFPAVLTWHFSAD